MKNDDFFANKMPSFSFKKQDLPQAPQSVRGLKTVQFNDLQKTKIKVQDLNTIKENSMSIENSNEMSIEIQEDSSNKKKIKSNETIEIKVFLIITYIHNY